MVVDISLVDLEVQLRQLEYSIDPEYLQKCRAICNAFKISTASSFVNQLHSFVLSTSINNESIGKRQVDQTLLDAFQSFLQNSAKKTLTLTNTSYNKATLNELEDDILEFYCSSETKEKLKAKQFEEILRAQHSLQSHNELLCSPNKSQSGILENFQNRTDKGRLEVKFSPTELDFVFNKENNEFELLNSISGFKRYANKIHTVFDALNLHIESMENELLEQLKVQLNDDELVFSHPLQSCTEEFYTAGMISIDSADGQAFLQTSKQTGMNARVSLKLDQLESFALFSGKIVAIKGKALDNASITVTALFEPSISPASTLDNKNYAKKSVSAFICAGPYTIDDGLNFEPLDELLLSIPKECNFLFMFGPFLDESNSTIKMGNLAKFPETILLEDIFEKRIFNFCKLNPTIQVFIIPSPKEASPFISPGCIPQPPIQLNGNDANIYNGSKLAESENNTDVPSNLVFVSNPAELLLCKSLRVSLANSDILFNLSKEEIVKNPTFSTDRMSRMCGYLLEQRSFHPLVQPSCIEFEHLSQLKMTSIPDILIVPSSLRHFVKQLNNCLVINPGQLCRSQSGGVFCHLRIDSDGNKEVLIQKC